MINILSVAHLQDTDLAAVDVSRNPGRLRQLYERPHRLLPSGRAAIAEVLTALRLRPEDEVLIANSTGQTYVASCVTCAIFNFCKPARVLSPATRAIFVIHEYGLPHPHLFELAAAARDRHIPLIEDCAHGASSSLAGTPVGMIGQYVIFSLPKILPLPFGGALVADRLPESLQHGRACGQVEEVAAAFARYEPYLDWLAQRRRENFAALRELFKDRPVLFELATDITPSFFGLIIDRAADIRQECSTIEWGSTLRDDLLLIPTNPLVPVNQLRSEARRAVDEVACRK